MHLDGTDLRRESLAARRSILKALIGRDEESRIQFSEEFVGEGALLFKACAEHGLEGSLQTIQPSSLALSLARREACARKSAVEIGISLSSVKLHATSPEGPYLR
jgi:hypothetical protein